LTGLTVDEIVPDSLSLDIGQDKLIYREVYKPDEGTDSLRVAEMTRDVVDSYADYIEEAGYDDVDVYTRVFESGGNVHANVEVDYEDAELPGVVPVAIAATELMALLNLMSLKMWFLVADTTSPPGISMGPDFESEVFGGGE